MKHTLLIALLFCAGASAQEFPLKPVRLIVPFGAGGGTDIIARGIAQKLYAVWSQPVIIDNRPGANGTIGVDLAAKAAPDGYTLAMISSSHTVNVSLYRKPPYDLINDLAPITQLTTQPYVLAINPSLPAHSVAELVTLAHAKPGAINYASSGTGGLSHLAGALFAQQSAIKITHIPYKGGTPGMNDLIAGQVQMLFSTILQANPHIRSGRLRALAVTSVRRTTAMPTVPTMQEAGVPQYEVAGWYGMVAPTKTPNGVIAKLQSEISAALRLPELRERLTADGSEAVGGTSEQLGLHMRAEVARWAKVIRDSRIDAE